MSFLDNISDFYHWMAQFDEVNARSRTNYISWLKFLSNNYDIDEKITEESIYPSAHASPPMCHLLN